MGHSRTVLSQDPEARREPSALNATLVTMSEWPSRVAIDSPVATSHSRTVLSQDPEARREPPALNATEIIPAAAEERQILRKALSRRSGCTNVPIELGSSRPSPLCQCT